MLRLIIQSCSTLLTITAARNSDNAIQYALRQKSANQCLQEKTNGFHDAVDRMTKNALDETVLLTSPQKLLTLISEENDSTFVPRDSKPIFSISQRSRQETGSMGRLRVLDCDWVFA